MWGVAKIFASGHSKGGFDRTPRIPLATGMERYVGGKIKRMGGVKGVLDSFTKA